MSSITTVKSLLERFKGSKQREKVCIRKIGWPLKKFYSFDVLKEKDLIVGIQVKKGQDLENLHLSDEIEFIVIRQRLLRDVYHRHKVNGSRGTRDLESVYIKLPAWRSFCKIISAVNDGSKVVGVNVDRDGKIEQVSLSARVEYVKMNGHT